MDTDQPNELKIEMRRQIRAMLKNISPAVRAVLRRQASRAQRRACADAVIHNDGIGLDELRGQVLTLCSRWLGPSAGST